MPAQSAIDDPAQGTPDSPLHARERELRATANRNAQAQQALSERIRELEHLQAQLIERANQLGANLSRPTAPAPPFAATAPAATPLPSPAVESAPEPVAGTEPASGTERPNAWPLFLALLVAVAAALFGFQRLRRGKRAARALPLTSTRAPEARMAQKEIPQPNCDRAAPSPPPAPASARDDVVEAHQSAVELADIMMSFGRMQGAAEALAEFIRSKPRQALEPWLKLLDVYRAADMRPEFDGLSRRLNKTFNVKTVTWDNYNEARSANEHIEDMPHLVKRLCRDWGTVDCQAYLEHLLRDNREGTRQGFPLSVIDELLTLSSVLEADLGRYHPPVTTQQPSPPNTLL